MVCQQCEDLKTTTALLCKNHLPIELNNDIKKYIRCTQCDLKKILLKHSSNLKDFSSPSSLRKELKDTDLVKYININSASYLHEVWGNNWNCVSNPSSYFDRFCGGREVSYFNQKNWTREKILNMKKSHYLDLNILCYKVYLHRCAQHLSNQELNVMEKFLRKIFL